MLELRCQFCWEARGFDRNPMARVICVRVPGGRNSYAICADCFEEKGFSKHVEKDGGE
jgi:hypothetical protein